MWEKKGLIFNTNKNHEWMVSHACVPTAWQKDAETIRIFFAPRNAKGQSIPTFLDVAAADPSKVIHLHDAPIMNPGETGTFDDSGIMPCSITEHEGRLYLYYVGWNPAVTVPYRNSIGLAVSDNGGVTFQRLFKGPVVDRNLHEPFFTASPCVLKEGDLWRMWYASSTGFVMANGKPEPLYVIKYATSSDGIHWQRPNITCILPKSEYEANARPTVIIEGGIYKMWFTYRGSFDYRDGKDSYRIGYAESTDGIDWKRMDERAGINLSPDGWDSKMQTYPDVLRVGEELYLFYNGNGFGRTGIGYARWVHD
ncbi:MAG: hypothetical protein WD077_06835 [Bacteroidia bacterium]